MIATAPHKFEWRKLRLTQSEVLRMLLAGTAWGALTSVGLAGMRLWNCGMICQHDLVVTAALSIATGILAIGPIATYGRR